MEVDLIVKGSKVYNSYLKKFIEEDIVIHKGMFLHIGNDYEDRLTSKKVLDGEGKFIIPGLIDIHMHIESSMTIPSEFSKAVIKHGVTTVVADPHEIANVFGLEGIETFMKDEEVMDIFYGIPSSVPSTSKELETTGAVITEEEVKDLLKNKKIRCLGEVMNFKDVTSFKSTEIKRIIDRVKSNDRNLPLEGHCPKVSGVDLSLFLYSGVNGDHTQQTVDSLKEKIKRGMFIEIQNKSITKENIDFLVENKLYEHFSLVTDDVMADKLTEGHLNKLVAKVISLGMPIEEAIYVSTFTPARRMALNDRGTIASGKIADFIILNDVETFDIDTVFKDGKAVYNKEIGLVSEEDFNHKTSFPEKFYNSIKLKPLTKEDFKLDLPNKEKVNCRVMNVKGNTTFTEEQIIKLNIENYSLKFEEKDCSLIAVFERYGNGNKAFGLVNGNINKNGAIATTWAHDHHNLMVMGRNVEDIVIAANKVIEMGGGYTVVNKGEILASVELPIGGIISDEPIEVLGDKLKKVREAIKSLGYDNMNEIMSFSTLSLPVSPDLKITDKGLIKVKENKIVPLFI